MRIGFDVSPVFVSRAGIARYAHDLYRHLETWLPDEIVPLAHRPPQETRAADGGDDPAAVDAWDRLRGVPRWSRLRPNRTLWMQGFLPRELRRLDLDVCHFTGSLAPVWGSCPTVVTIHDMSLWLLPQHHYARRLLSNRPLLPLAVRRAAAVIAISRSARADIIRVLGVPPGKVHVVHAAVSARFRPLPRGPDLEAVRRRLELPDRFILAVGSIEPRKNLVRLLEAYAELRRDRRHRGVGLVLAGSPGWKYEPVYETVARLDLVPSVRFLGYVPDRDLVPLYNLATLLALPSVHEGFGLPVLEAMACGTPVVTSRGGALEEVAGGAAELVEPLDVAAVARGLHRVLDDGGLRDEMRARGLSRAASFTWRQAALQTREVYERAVAAGSRPGPPGPPVGQRRAEAAGRPAVEADAGSDRVAACIVHYDGGALDQTLEALHRAAEPVDEILVADNASTDGSLEEARRRFPEVRVLRMGENRGAAAARNAAFRATTAPLLLFLDNDAVPLDRCMSELRKALRDHPRAALAMPRVLDGRRPGRIQYDGAGCHFTGLMTLLDGGASVRRARGTERPGEVRRLSSVVSACFLLDRRRWGEELPFHDAFFIYLEDHDLGMRARVLGHEILAVPGALCLHGEGTAGLSLRRTGRHTPLRVYHVVRNRWLLLLLNFGARSLLVLAPALLLFEALQLAGAARKGWLRHWLRAAAWIGGHLPWILSRRREIQSRRRVPDREILEGGPLPLTDPLLATPVERAIRGAAERLLEAHWRLARRLL